MYFEEFSLSDDFESSLQTLIDILLLSQEVYPKKRKKETHVRIATSSFQY